MEDDEAANPGRVRLPRSRAEPPRADRGADAVEEPWGRRRVRHSICHSKDAASRARGET